MGTEFKLRSFKAMNVSELRERVESHLFQDGHEDGVCYSGSWGSSSGELVFHDDSFLDEQVAIDWLEQNCVKRGPLIAAKVFVPQGVSKSESNAIEAAERRFLRLKAEVGLHNYGFNGVTSVQKNALDRAKSGKSALRTCPTCESRISMQHLHAYACPVCGDGSFLLTKADKDRLKRLTAKIEDAKGEIDRLKLKKQGRDKKATSKSGADWRWFVAANCPS